MQQGFDCPPPLCLSYRFISHDDLITTNSQQTEPKNKRRHKMKNTVKIISTAWLTWDGSFFYQQHTVKM